MVVRKRLYLREEIFLHAELEENRAERQSNASNNRSPSKESDRMS
jgi:hypothetical protein